MDNFWNLTSLLVRAKSDAVTGNNNNTIIDSSTNNYAITRNGNVTQGTFSPYDNFGGSMYFDGTGDSLSLAVTSPSTYSNGDFTIEAWIYSTGQSTGDMCIVETRSAESNSSGWCLNIKTANRTLRFYTGTTGFDGTIVMTHNQWYHVAASKSGSTLRTFVNGKLDGTFTLTNTFTDTVFRVGQGVWANCNWIGFISDVRSVKGTALYTANFDVPSAPLINISGTQILLSCANAKIIDDARKTNIETVGNAKVNTSIAKFNPGISQTTAGDMLIIPDSNDVRLTSDFTIEGWMYPSGNYTTYNTILAKRNAQTASCAYELYLRATTGVFSYYNGTNYESTTTPTANTWSHFAATLKGTTLRLFLNGIQVHKATIAVPTDVAYPLYIGNVGNGAETYYGSLDDIRITKGYARYLTNFTPPSLKYPTVYYPENGDSLYNNVILHMHMDGQNGSTNIVEQTGRVVSVFGNAQISTGQSKFVGSSCYFDGNGDYLTVPNSADFNFGAGDFTIEAWVYPQSTTVGAGKAILNQSMPGASSNSSFYTDLTTDGASLYVSTGAGWQYNATASGKSYGGAWHHAAWIRSGTQLMVFVDGINVATTTLPVGFTLGSSTRDIEIGIQGSYFQGYIEDLRVTKGIARYVTSFTLPTTKFPHHQDFYVDNAKNRSILLKYQSSVTTTGLKNYQNKLMLDSSSNNYAVTTTGNVTQGTFSPYSNSGWSGYFAGADYLSMAYGTQFLIGSSDYTVECWINTYDTVADLVSAFNSTSPFPGWLFGIGFSVAGKLSFFNANGTTNETFSGTNTVNDGKWHHIAAVKSGSTLTFFIDGIVDSTHTMTIVGTGSNSTVYIGKDANPSPSRYYTGHISNLRIVKGTAVYTSNFTPSTIPLTAITNTQLLTLQDNRFKDSSSNNVTITPFGDVRTQPFSPFAPAVYNTTTHGGSMRFDGTGDYLKVGTTNAPLSWLNPSSAQGCIEAWVYPTTHRAGNFNYTHPCIVGLGGTYLNVGIANGTPRVYWWDGSQRLVDATSTIPLNTWTHIAWVFNAGTVTIYLNGKSSGSGTYTGIAWATGSGGNDVYVGIEASNNATSAFLGHLADVRISSGTQVYTGNFSVATAPLTTNANTQLLLKGTNAALIDYSGKVNVELLGNTKVDTINKKYNTSLSFDGATGSYVQLFGMPGWNDFGAGNFTIEFWYYKITSKANATLMQLNDSANAISGMHFNDDSGTLRLYLSSNGSSWDISNATVCGTTLLNTWHHIVLSRSDGKIYAYLDGVLKATIATTAAIYYSKTLNPVIGGNLSNPERNIVGFIEDFRITKGIARYV